MSFNIVLEQQPKEQVLSELERMCSEGLFDETILSGMKAIVLAQKESHVSIGFNGSDEKSGYVYASWNSTSDIRDVPTDAERMMNDSDRINSMMGRLGRQPKL